MRQAAPAPGEGGAETDRALFPKVSPASGGCLHELGKNDCYGPGGENRWSRWRRLLVPSLFLLGSSTMKNCFEAVLFPRRHAGGGAVHPVVHPAHRDPAGTAVRRGRPTKGAGAAAGNDPAALRVDGSPEHLLSPVQDLPSQLSPLTKMGMVAGAFGDMAVGEILLNWFPIAMMAVPFGLAVVFRRRLIPEEGPMSRRMGVRWSPAGGGGPAGCHGHRDVLRRGLHVPALHLSPGGGAGTGGAELWDADPEPAGAAQSALQGSPRRTRASGRGRRSTSTGRPVSR